ncbi:hypothetical protein DM02DRAFT_612205 [Periconia macrospinosa]|uniref:Uncharacterized protein n=1 Tax=Periconia macrospinosa TaxID=97972 RepID=A0A2V1DZ00_9PLEO|nr:hypothetical protein DM02DRAFT_612205 [Periconia macrospinosa]
MCLRRYANALPFRYYANHHACLLACLLASVLFLELKNKTDTRPVKKDVWSGSAGQDRARERGKEYSRRGKCRFQREIFLLPQSFVFRRPLGWLEVGWMDWMDGLDGWDCWLVRFVVLSCFGPSG